MIHQPGMPTATDRTRVDRAFDHYRQCMLCEHRCGVDRLAGGRGPCKAGAVPRIFRHRVEYGEELHLVPSHLFYLSGCDLRCVFCIAELNAFDPGRGRELTSDFFNEAVAWGQKQGARNVQWVGGEPTIHLPAVLKVMADCPDLPPIVWKSDFYGTPEAFDFLNGAVDVFVADLKFGNDSCANQLAGIHNYFRIVTRNLKAVDAAGGKLIVRHLLLPGHAECCYRPIVEWMAAELPQTQFSLRDSYLPSWRAKRFGELAVPLSRSAGCEALALARRIGLNIIQ